MIFTSPTYPLGYNTPLFMPVTSPICSLDDDVDCHPRTDFGDPRRQNAFTWLAATIHRTQSCSLNGMTINESQRKRAERFVNNHHFSVGEVIEQCCVPIASPVLQGRKILNVMDQTTIEFASAVGRVEGQEQMLGRIGNGFQYGQNCLAGLLVGESDYKVMGLSSLSFHSDEVHGTSSRDRIGRDERPLRYRNSFKWTQGVRQARLRAKGATGLLHVVDREGDNLNFLLEAFSSPLRQDLQEDFIIRAKVNRQVIAPQDGQSGQDKIKSILEAHAPTLCYWVEVTGDERMSFSADYGKGGKGRSICRVQKRKGRRARLEIRVVSCRLDVEHMVKTKSDMSKQEAKQLVYSSDLSTRPLSYVQVREVDVEGKPVPVPEDKKDKANRPINWLLMTTLGVENPEDILRIIDIYRMRFPLVEQLFRATKADGIDIESAQHQSLRVLQIMTAMSMKSSALVMKMIGARNVDDGFPIEDDFTEREIEVLEMCNIKYNGKTIKQANLHPKGQLSWAVWVIARMGGWKPGNKKRPAGPKTMQRGLEMFYNIYEGVALARGWV